MTAHRSAVRRSPSVEDDRGAIVRLLVVEDDPRMVALLTRVLEEDGYAVDSTGDGQDALWLATEHDYDAIVLDGMLPGLDGVDVVRGLRDAGRWTPVLLLTARSGFEDRVAGLDAGADDYLAKPFNYGELAARIRALIRRGASARPAVLRNGDLRLDPASRRVTRAGDRIELTTKEFALLELLLRHRGDVLSRTFIFDHVWDFAFDPASNVIDQYIASLRRKLDRPYQRDDVQTIRGAGYRLRRIDDAPPDEH
jgi:two-component system, OmpR family, response regulator